MRISDWSSDVCSSDLSRHGLGKDSAGTSGRSAREATGKFKEASKMRLMNCTRGVAGAAAAFALVASFGAQAADPASCKEVSLADVGWTDITATTAATSVVLEGLGYQPEAEVLRSEEPTSEIQSLMRNSYAVLCLKQKNPHNT